MEAEEKTKRCPTCGRDGYHSPSVTVDAVAARETEYGLELLMIERGPDPAIWEGKWAFPGGFVDYGEDHAFSNSFRGIKDHKLIKDWPSIFHNIGTLDLTAYVNFKQLAAVAR